MGHGLHYQRVLQALPYLLGGAGESVMLALMAFLMALVLGLGLAIARMESSSGLRPAASGFVIFFTNTPQLSQIFAMFYCLPMAGINLSPFVSVLLGMTLNASAYLSNILVAGIGQTPRIYHEAADTLGLNLRQKYMRIIVPHVLRIMYPALNNHFVIMLLGTSMASIFGVEELTGRAYYLASVTFRSFEVLSITAVLYVAMSFLASRLLMSLRRLV
ncbi:amino acid ABC transporter permease [Komagataeibacter sp. AV436]|uniref:Amino acid ABC transporter permease n=1 Tax=Komagataeibacter melomenusus TaxID=2766578 RepID=A0ABX2ACW6_9PROT|nr:amino acid ABC transporter permease [Komagataeibacter melomenusus]MBV1829169.1 amino acid ABC transporter permease [Komagataeibacter melomenusus]NPC65492.1 amino acid ABC transporter permease [Komagataeibacter melomenusus]